MRIGGDAPVGEVVHIVAGIHGEIAAIGTNQNGGGGVIVLGLEGVMEDDAGSFSDGQIVGGEVDVAGARFAIGAFGSGDGGNEESVVGRVVDDARVLIPAPGAVGVEGEKILSIGAENRD